MEIKSKEEMFNEIIELPFYISYTVNPNSLSTKDKAKELVDKFDRNIFIRDVEGLSKQCALICCNEILEGLAIGTFATSSVGAYEYWQQVKSEIEKL